MMKINDFRGKPVPVLSDGPVHYIRGENVHTVKRIDTDPGDDMTWVTGITKPILIEIGLPPTKIRRRGYFEWWYAVDEAKLIEYYNTLVFPIMERY